MKMIHVQLLTEHARLPTRGSPLSAGADLHAAESKVIPAGAIEVVSTGLRLVNAPRNVYLKVESRSGLSVNHFINVNAGVIDADYRGEIKVVLRNSGTEPYHVSIGDRIAQLVTILIEYPTFAVADAETSTNETARGAGGFGSTGR